MKVPRDIVDSVAALADLHATCDAYGVARHAADNRVQQLRERTTMQVPTILQRVKHEVATGWFTSGEGSESADTSTNA